MSSNQSFRSIFGFDPDSENRCVGEAKSKGRRCKLIINVNDKHSASHLMNCMDRSRDFHPAEDDLRRLAGLMLCRQCHNSASKPDLCQIREVVSGWNQMIGEEYEMVSRQRENEALRQRRRELERIKARAEEVEARLRMEQLDESLEDSEIGTEEEEEDEEVSETIIITSKNERERAPNTIVRVSTVELVNDDHISATNETPPRTRQATSPTLTIPAGRNLFPATPEKTPPHRQEPRKTEEPATPTNGPIPFIFSNLPEVPDNVPHTPHFAISQAVSEFTSSSKAGTAQFNFGFTQPLTPPSTIKTKCFRDHPDASKDLPPLLTPEGTPTRPPLGELKTSRHNRHMKIPVSPLRKPQQSDLCVPQSFPSLPTLPVFNFRISETNTGLSKDLSPSPLFPSEMQEPKKGLKDSPTMPDDLPTPSKAPQPRFLDHGGELVLIDKKVGINDSEDEEEDNKENQDPIQYSFPAVKSGDEISPSADMHEPDSQSGIGYVTLITTTSYRTTYTAKPYHQQTTFSDPRPEFLPLFSELPKRKPLPPPPTEPGKVFGSQNQGVENCPRCGNIRCRCAIIPCDEEMRDVGGCGVRSGLKRLKDRVVRELREVRGRVRRSR